MSSTGDAEIHKWFSGTVPTWYSEKVVYSNHYIKPSVDVPSCDPIMGGIKRGSRDEGHSQFRPGIHGAVGTEK